jgi:hypothetical protein
VKKEKQMRRVITGRAAALIAVGALALGVPHPPGAAAAVKDEGGPARVVIPASSGTAPGDLLTSGDASTKWTLALPQAASCTGDTAIGNYHIFTYEAPSTVDPATLHFGNDGPDNNDQAHPLFDDGGAPFTAGATGLGTGQVLPVPFTTFMWGKPPSPFDSSNLPPGTYNIGVACADAAMDKFWNVQETFTGDPAGTFAWTVVAAGPTDSTSSTTSTTTDPTGSSTTSTTLGSSDSTTTTTTPDSSTTSTTIGDDTTTTSTVVGAGSDSGSSGGDPLSSTGGGSSSGGLALTGGSVMKLGGLGVILFGLGWAVDIAARRRPQRRER